MDLLSFTPSLDKIHLKYKLDPSKRLFYMPLLGVVRLLTEHVGLPRFGHVGIVPNNFNT